LNFGLRIELPGKVQRINSEHAHISTTEGRKISNQPQKICD